MAQATAGGVTLVAGRLVAVEPPQDAARPHTLRVRGADGETALTARSVVLAVGPYLRSVGRLFGVDFPVVNEIHARVRPCLCAAQLGPG